MRLKCILHIILAFSFSSLSAQQINIGFKQFTITNGLTDNNTNAIIQDSRGMLWIGSSSGLTRYDGRTFKKYMQLGKARLTDLSIICLAEDDEGNIWIGTENGLNKLNPFTENITQYYEGAGPGTIPFRWCNFIYIDKEKRLWLTTEKGIALYDKGTNSFQNYPVTVNGEDTRINKFINKVIEDSKGRFWLATSFGIKLFNKQTKTYKTFLYKKDDENDNHRFAVLSLLEDNNGVIWAGTWGDGLLKFDEAAQEFKKKASNNLNSYGSAIPSISQIRIQSWNYLLLATSKGLALVKNDTAITISYTSLAGNVNSILKDRQGNFWISSDAGLYKMNTNSLAFQWIILPAAGNEREPIFHIIPDIKKPNSLFYLTTIKGWWQYDAATQIISKYDLPADPKNLLTYINTWYTDTSKGYWFSSVKGLGFFNPYQKKLEDLASLPIERSGQPGTGIIAIDSKDNLWATLPRSGILVYDRHQKKAITLFNEKDKPGNTVNEDIHDLRLAENGYVYFTAVNNLYKVNVNDYSYKTIAVPQPNDRIDVNKIAPGKMFFTKDGRFFLTSRLCVYELKNDTLSKIYPASGYADFIIDKAYCAPNGIIWVTTSAGVFKTDTSFKQWININNRLGWPGNERILDIYANKTGEVFFSGEGKIGILKDSLLQKSTAPPPVIINRIKYGEQENYMVSLKPVSINSSYKDPIEIEVASTNFINETENKIFYALEGWDNNWKELSGQSFVRYEQLPAGTYTFSAKQVNAEGIESKITSIAFNIAPPFYKTWWFILLLVFSIAFILFAFYRFRLKKALEMERLRTRIATDLHDDIGATLSSISMYSDAVKQQVKEKFPHLEPVMDKIGENSRDMVNSMSDIVWAINPDNDDGGKLLQRIENYARDLCSVKDIQFLFKADPEIGGITLPLEYRKNIYLIFKESLNNALKYADAKNIVINISKSSGLFKMILKDDGKGFNTSLSTGGNGLKNMEERAKEIKGSSVIGSSPDKGTTVTFSCRIP